MRFATQEQMTRGYYGTYNDVKEIIVNEVQKQYEYGCDIAQAIRSGTKFDIKSVQPTREVSTETDDMARKHEQDGLDIMFQEELRVFMERKKYLRENEIKTYSLIISNYCTKQMKTRIEEHPDYASKILDNPIELLEKIKTLTHDTVRAQYPIASITDHLARWLNVKQLEDENLMDYVKRSKYHRDIVKSQIGTAILHDYVKTTPEYVDEVDVDKQHELLKGSFERLSAYVMMRGSDNSKYGSLMKGLVSQYSMKHDQYPKTMTDAVDVLSKHSFDQAFYDRNKRARERSKQKEDEETKTSLAQTSYRCHICGADDHPKKDCPKSGLPRNEWFVTRAMEKLQCAQDEDKNDEKRITM